MGPLLTLPDGYCLSKLTQITGNCSGPLTSLGPFGGFTKSSCHDAIISVVNSKDGIVHDSGRRGDGLEQQPASLAQKLSRVVYDMDFPHAQLRSVDFLSARFSRKIPSTVRI